MSIIYLLLITAAFFATLARFLNKEADTSRNINGPKLLPASFIEQERARVRRRMSAAKS